jgi:hypothetical protein
MMLPGNIVVEKVDFERHLMGLFGRLGCNAGSCHGSFQGKGGFRLSLFGYDPGKDHAALTRDVMGRRINALEPDQSLLLLKATGQIAHGGGRRFARASWQYRMFREWIASGARWQKGKGDVAGLTVSPSEYAIIQAGRTAQLRVRARFADGTEEDVTCLCDFRVQDDAVAEMTGPGTVKALHAGDSGLVVSYRGTVRALRVLVPMPLKTGLRFPNLPDAGYIDREVFAKLRLLNMAPSDLAGDAEFLRRVTIDTIGCLPAPEDVRAFLADRSPDKRAKQIDALLAQPLHAALWATKLSDITGNNTRTLFVGGPPARFSQMWHDWLRKRIADNIPYDEMVKGILCATSRDGRSLEAWMRESKEIDEASKKSFVASYAAKKSLDLFWRLRGTTLQQLGERTASAFMGIRLECAQCHKHPFDRWTQVDYRAYANVFGRVAVGAAPDTSQALGLAQNKGKGKKAAKAKVQARPPVVLPKGAGLINEVFIRSSLKSGRLLHHPDFVPVVKTVVLNAKGKKSIVLATQPTPLPPKALGGPVIEARMDEDPRVALFEWLRSPRNPYFARSFVNRIWGHYLGVGLVDPVDNFSLANPPSNAALLDALAADFVEHKFDIRHMERTILNSRVYQLSSTMNETNTLDRNNYAHSYVRPMMAEVVVDVLNSALGVVEDFGADARPGSRAIEIGASRVTGSDLGYAFRLFGRPDRNLSCECERDLEPSLPQTLYLMTDPTVLAKLRATLFPAKGKPSVASGTGKPAGKSKRKAVPPTFHDTRLAKLLHSDKNDAEILDELFLATLTRFPTAAEKKHFTDYHAARKSRAAETALVDEAPKKKKKAAPVSARNERDEAFIDALWALINTREFILNH